MKFAGLLGFLGLPLAAAYAMSVTVTPSTSSPAPLGSVVHFTASAIGAEDGALTYRFRVRPMEGRTRRGVGPAFRTVVDYGPNAALDWATIEREGAYQIEASIKNQSTGEVASETIAFELSPRVTGQTPLATATDHPLVFVYSAPACPAGGQMRVQFQAADGVAQNTPSQECDGRHTMNFYLAGMRAGSTYTARHTVEWRGATTTGPAVSLTTGDVPMKIPAATPLSTPVPAQGGILLQSVISASSIATDLNGNVVWYGPSGMSLLTRVGSGGRFLGILEDGSKGPERQFFREFDLAGITVAETNAARVNEQLAAMGVRPITSFHHEAIHLADGRFLVLAGSEQILNDVQGPGPVDVLGDTILVLDDNLQVQWAWDSFAHLDPARRAVLGEQCTYPASLACSVFYGAKTANDWLHGNAVQLTPDGNILYSIRHQDWIAKIDYRNGIGSGAILWKLGRGGDFKVSPAVPEAWFSHQHDPQFLPDGVTLIVFDNGNTRIQNDGQAGTSRGQVWRIDEQSRTATLQMNADLKVNSSALGTAQALDNGHYHFDAGFVPDPSNPAARLTQALEVDQFGTIVWGMQINAQEYRSYRLVDLYTPPAP